MLASFGSIRTREKEYYAWMLLLLVAMNACSLPNTTLFYVLPS